MPEGLWLAAALALLLFLGARWISRWFRRLRIRARLAHARGGEARAAGWLMDLGYEIIGIQVAAEYELWIDEEPLTIGLRADYLVEKGGRRYVAEVKTGKLAPRLDTAATRRQLLEYRVAFGVDGALLVDAEAGTVRVISFRALALPPA
jgi:hypothetical protein